MNRHLYLLMETGNELPEATLPILQELLAKGRAKLAEAIFEPSLVRDFGIESEAYAAISWLGEDNDPETYCWMYADPVHFSLQRDYFSLAWWNTGSCGAFDLTSLWARDTDIGADMTTEFGLIGRVHRYPDSQGYEVQFKAIGQAWRPGLGD